MPEDKDLIAYCGLYCGDCFGHKGTIADLARDLRKELRQAHFGRIAGAMAETPFFAVYKDYPVCYEVLGAMVKFRCKKSCRGGGGPPFDDALASFSAAGIPVEVPAPGWRAAVGDFTLEVIGPRRRYAGDNDGSIVLWVTAAERTILLPGDIEAVAQRELGPMPADVMKVPHQGAATSDLGWLAASAPRVAIISVGPNDFGHPSRDVIAALEEAGATVELN